jgi:hypothetical protein
VLALGPLYDRPELDPDAAARNRRHTVHELGAARLTGIHWPGPQGAYSILSFEMVEPAWPVATP